MFEKMDEVKKAKAQIVEGACMIWNARLDMLVNSGNLTGTLDQLNRAVETGDNCSCNSGCGAMSAQDLSALVSRFKTK